MKSLNIPLSGDDFKFIQQLMYDSSGVYIEDGRFDFVHLRLAEIVRLRQLKDFKEYCKILTESREHVQEMVDALTTNLTHFFRESHHFKFLKEVIFSELKENNKVRIWSSACSTGEEAYSIAMEALSYFSLQAGKSIQVLASDIDSKSLQKSRARNLSN
ncbi:CheR family methyltransferase [Piscirickettsia litoralis]|uniref:protein-glutamate O-methyltransferase n=1 Tax=Piscirickettsia litoralis TaxID=1891921 RepID=A0ABX3A3V0_9GAMM|nr:CheR family methyltransferase [Piscirickettsia litoralis]ODN42115.1 hypothetical protein BGC07_03075 [Piscirickettsia litoralis]